MTKERKCLACGKTHDGIMCPLIKNKFDTYFKSSKKEFLIGNIVLQYIYKNADFYQTLCEIAEINEYIEQMDINHIFSTVVPLDVVEYFALSLGCSSKEFYKSPKQLSKEYVNILYSGYEDSGHIILDDNNHNVAAIEFEFDVDSYEYTSPNSFNNHPCNFTIEKTKESQNTWSYNLYINFDMPITSKCLQSPLKKSEPRWKMFYWSTMYQTSGSSLLLLSEYNGPLKDFFESELDDRWTDDSLVTELPLDDNRFNIWMNKLEQATSAGQLDWKCSKHRYRTTFENTEIEIDVDLDSDCGDSELLYVRNGDGGTGFRFGFRNYEYIEDDTPRIIDKKRNPRILKLEKEIKNFISNKKTILRYDSLPQVIVNFSDVLVRTKSMICHGENHYLRSYRGIVKLLTKEGSEIEYEIYTCYCITCNQYFIFEHDFLEMLKIGTPLCTVLYGNKNNDSITHKSFRYKSQSVLNAMGYTVDMNISLTKEERQKILATALENQLFSVADLLNFLHWLIKTRETQSKYNTAVSKWKDDLKFVENYKKNTRDKINITSIRTK